MTHAKIKAMRSDVKFTRAGALQVLSSAIRHCHRAGFPISFSSGGRSVSIHIDDCAVHISDDGAEFLALSVDSPVKR